MRRERMRTDAPAATGTAAPDPAVTRGAEAGTPCGTGRLAGTCAHGTACRQRRCTTWPQFLTGCLAVPSNRVRARTTVAAGPVPREAPKPQVAGSIAARVCGRKGAGSEPVDGTYQGRMEESWRSTRTLPIW